MPFEIPPCIPPEKLVLVVPSALYKSLCSLPFILAPQKPLPYSKPLTALMDSMAFPSSACSLSKTGSPKPIGTFCRHTGYSAANGIAFLADFPDIGFHLFGGFRIGTTHGIGFCFGKIQSLVRFVDKNITDR